MDNKQHTDMPVSDELINSFIDHQITLDERQELLARIRQDKQLAERVRQLQRTKEMTRLAYQHIPESRHAERTLKNESSFPRLAAVFAIFSLGLLIGLAVTQMGEYTQKSVSVQADQSETKVLVHLTSDNIESGISTLDNLHLLLQEYRARRQPVQVEVIANGKGIRLLDPDNHEVARRVEMLTRAYPNLNIAACKYSIEQLRISRGKPVHLMPQVKLIDSGIVEAIKRQNEGWTYIRG